MKTFDKTLTYLYYIEISVAIKIKFCLLLILKIMRDFSAKTKNKDQCTIIKKFMYEKLCYKLSTSKYEILNRNNNMNYENYGLVYVIDINTHVLRFFLYYFVVPCAQF